MDSDDDFRYDELDNQIIEAITCSGAYWDYEQRKAIRRLIQQEIAKARIDTLEYAKISPKFKIEERIEQLKQGLERL